VVCPNTTITVLSAGAIAISVIGLGVLVCAQVTSIAAVSGAACFHQPDSDKQEVRTGS